MHSRTRSMLMILAPVLCLVVLGCQTGSPGMMGGAESKIRPATGTAVFATPEPIEEAHGKERRKARAQRAQWANKTFEEFERSVYKEPFPGGKYIVDGDIAIADRKQLQEFFETRIKQEPPQTRPGQLIVARAGGQGAIWNNTQKKRISYCVSTTFGARHASVVTAMQGAAGAWSQIADVAFVYVASQDAACTASNANVVFDVRPVNVNGQYLARAFFPNEPRAARNVLIDDSAFRLDPVGKLTLVGILRHQLGHTLGWRHEHTRPESGTCFEDNDWRPLTSYDRFSVMHYPQCNGGGDWSLALTNVDKIGAACLYGAAPGFSVDPTICPTGAGPGDNFAVLRVFYATDRQLGTPAPVTFTPARNARGGLTLGTFDVSIPRQHRLGSIERPSVWRLEFREDRQKHFVFVDRTVKSTSTFYNELAQRVQRSETKEALVFIHGYNVGFDDAVFRTAQISYDLGFAGAPILYSWPSNGSTLEYPGDVNNSEWSIDHLQAFLKDVVARSQASSIHLVAHSMGNRVLAGALARLAADASFTPLPKFTHVVLTAPDIDADVFRQLAAAITRTARRTTLYASSNDKALQLSKQINGYPRAGDAGPGILVLSGVDTIDVSAVDTDLIGHSYYGDNRSVLSDVFNLLRGQTLPRFGLKEATLGSRSYWRFAP